MPEVERDSTQDWLVPAAARPATMHELEQRVDVALAVARSAEAAAVEIGAAAFDAAEQARRAAESAERAVAGGAGVSGPRRAATDIQAGDYGDGGVPESDVGEGAIPVEVPGSGDDLLRHFTERADSVLARLRAIEQLPQGIG